MNIGIICFILGLVIKQTKEGEPFILTQTICWAPPQFPKP